MELINKNKRIEWIDFLKGICIILVMCGHRIHSSNGIISEVISDWIYSFHMPLFFSLSGMTFSIKKYNNFGKFVLKKIKTLLIPLVIFSFFKVIFEYFYYYIILNNNNYNNEKMINRLLGIFVQGRGKYESYYWFLSCLFMVEMLLYWLVKYLNNKQILFICFTLYFVGIIIANIVKSYLPWFIEVSCVAIFFVGLGYVFKQYQYNIKPSYAIVFLILNIVCMLINQLILKNQVDMVQHKYGNSVLFIFGSVSGILFFVCLGKTIKFHKIINYIGKNSLIYYIFIDWLMFIPEIIIYNILHLDLASLHNWNILVAVLSVILVLILIYPISVIINKKLPFILGKF